MRLQCAFGEGQFDRVLRLAEGSRFIRAFPVRRQCLPNDRLHKIIFTPQTFQRY
jgi:hypothetical protein